MFSTWNMTLWGERAFCSFGISDHSPFLLHPLIPVILPNTQSCRSSVSGKSVVCSGNGDAGKFHSAIEKISLDPTHWQHLLSEMMSSGCWRISDPCGWRYMLLEQHMKMKIYCWWAFLLVSKHSWCRSPCMIHQYALIVKTLFLRSPWCLAWDC